MTLDEKPAKPWTGISMTTMTLDEKHTQNLGTDVCCLKRKFHLCVWPYGVSVGKHSDYSELQTTEHGCDSMQWFAMVYNGL